MKNLLRKATPINEAARRELGISRDEYALCSYILYRCADPRQKVRGYCCDSKQDIADFIGITRAGLYKMADRLIALNLIECDSVTSFFTVTAGFIDMENECKQSLHNEKNVGEECKLSLQEGVNLVTHKELMYSKKEKENKYSVSEKQYWESCYSFDEFWNEYGYKIGSKKKAESYFAKLSEKDRADIKACLPFYLQNTVTERVQTGPGAAFRPFRAHATTFLNERRWESILESAIEQKQQNETLYPEWTDEYNQYLQWAETYYPGILKAVKQMSKAQFVRYRTEYYVPGKSFVGNKTERRLMTQAHRDMSNDPNMMQKYPDVFAYHCQLIEKEVKVRQI